MDIYSILASKPHNTHYLNRYMKFIVECQSANGNIKGHKHHICPKANDMFPEYISFSRYPWNMIVLTPRQHFIAHLILWKVYPDVASQMHALWQMRHRNNENLNSKLYESLRSAYQKNVSERFKNKVSVYDMKGNHIRIPKEEFWQNTDKYIAISADRIIARNLLGGYETVDINEFNKRDDLVGTTKGMKIWNDGRRHYVSFDKPGTELTEGMIKITEDEIKARTAKRQKTLYENYSKEEISEIRSISMKKYIEKTSIEQRKKSPQTRQKMSETAKRKNAGFTATCKCPVCGKEGQRANISRHHGLEGEKCKW